MQKMVKNTFFQIRRKGERKKTKENQKQKHTQINFARKLVIFEEE